MKNHEASQKHNMTTTQSLANLACINDTFILKVEKGDFSFLLMQCSLQQGPNYP